MFQYKLAQLCVTEVSHNIFMSPFVDLDVEITDYYSHLFFSYIFSWTKSFKSFWYSLHNLRLVHILSYWVCCGCFWKKEKCDNSSWLKNKCYIQASLQDYYFSYGATIWLKYYTIILFKSFPYYRSMQYRCYKFFKQLKYSAFIYILKGRYKNKTIKMCFFLISNVLYIRKKSLFSF